MPINNNIINQKGTPAFFSDIFANRPAFGYAGRVFISTDTGEIYEDTGTAWTLIADAGAGTTGTLQQVTTNGKTTTNGIVITTGNLAIGTATASAPLDIHEGTLGQLIQLNATSTNNSNIAFLNDNVNKWRIGNVYNAGANDFNIFNNGTSSNALSFNSTNNTASFSGLISNNILINTINGSGSADLTTSYTPTTTITGVNSYNVVSRYKLNLANGIYNGTANVNAANLFAFAVINGNNGTISTQAIKNVTSALAVETAAIKLSDYRAFNVNTLDSAIISGNIITDCYGLYINALKGTTNFTITNGWGIYQDGATDNNYFAGKILIGSSTDDTINKLQVTGSAKISSGLTIVTPASATAIDLFGRPADGFAAIRFKSNNGVTTYATVYSDSTNFIIENNALERLKISSAGVIQLSNLAGTGSRAVLADASGNLSAPVSDISVKQNIQTIGYGLNEILKMKPVWFDFIDEYKNYGEGRQNGNIAQEMEAIIPEAVFTTPSTGKMGINYDQLHAVYIKAIQELKAEIDAIKNN